MAPIFVQTNITSRRAATNPVGYLLPERDGCWEWTGGKSNGYGVWFDSDFPCNSHTRQAHRVMYERIRGPIPAGFVIDHLCTNRGCVNPEHMEVVTVAENSRRGQQRRYVR